MPQFHLALAIYLAGAVWKHMSWNLVPNTYISRTNHSKLHKPSEPSSPQLGNGDEILFSEYYHEEQMRQT